MRNSFGKIIPRAYTQLAASMLLLLGSVGLMVAIPSVAEAQLRVSSIDWVQGRPEIPHPAMNGKSTILQAIAEGGNCGGNYTYRWDTNGDGDFDDGGEHWRGANYHAHRNGYFAPLGLEMTFPNQPGDRIFYPKVEVDCAGQRVSTVVPYLVRVDRVCPNYPNDFNGGCREERDENILLTRALVHDRIIDRSMWWMFNQITHHGDDGRRGGVHGCQFWGSPEMYGQGMMLNVFLRRSHGYGPGRDIDAYYRHVTKCGLTILMGTYNMTTGMWFDDDGANGWDGWKMSYTGARLGGAWYYGSYGSTAWVEPAVNFGNPEYRSPGGEGNIQGRTLRDIGGDLRDGVMYCMAGSGQWYYSCRSDGHPDASTNGWAPESMRLLGRKFDMNTYSWARDRQRNWLNGNCSMNSNNDHRLFGCNYHVEWSYNGGVGKLAGNALVGYGWTQDQNFQNNAGNSAGNMREHWRAATRLDHNWWGIYYMYATTKGMRSFSPEISRFENGEDWATKFAHFLIRHTAHNQENYWRWCSNNNDHHCHWHWHGSFNPHTSTVIATQIVQTWLEAQAMARANPQSTGPGIPVTFDHSWSHILDPNVSLARFRWNVIDGPGEGGSPDQMVWEYTTDDLNAPFVFTYDANLGWDQVINKKVTLEVTDSQGRSVYDDKSVSITLSLKNHKPVVVAHPDGRNGIYSGYFGQTFALDASRSYETDQCIRDREDPNLPGGAAADIPRPEPVVVEIGDCDALSAQMEACLDNAAPGDVEAILRCVEMQGELERCQVMDEELQNCTPLQAEIGACEALIAAGEAGELEPDVEPPENCNAEEAAFAQCRADSVVAVNEAVNAALIAEWEEAVGGGGGGGEDQDGNCGGRELFPGDGDRPRGQPDRVTSICFDTNFNDRWCEPGEIQYEWHSGNAPRINAPIGFTPRQGMGEGDIIGVPVRVCDDGRWNGKCYQPGDGGPGHLTRGDCSECGYGTASLQVIQNAEPPTIEFNEPTAQPAIGRITVGGAPEDNQFIDVTDGSGNSGRVVFDRNSDQTVTTAPTTTFEVSGNPVDGNTFRLRDHTGNERAFVFRVTSEVADGSTSDVQGIPHVAIGTSGAAGLAGVAERVASSVNATGALDISARVQGSNVTLTQGSEAYSGNTKIRTEGINGMTTPPFVGGTSVGIRSVLNDRNAIAERIGEALGGESVPDEGLAVYLNFDEAGGNRAGDSSNNGLFFDILGGASFTNQARSGRALSLNGQGPGAILPEARRGATRWEGTFTHSYWMRSEMQENQAGILYEFATDPAAGNRCYTYGHQHTRNFGPMAFFGFPFGDNVGANYFRGGGAAVVNTNDGEWHHVVTTFDADRMHRVYVDGGMVTEGRPHGNARARWGGDLRIGAQLDRNNVDCQAQFRPFEGAIDEYRMYTRALSEREISALYAEFAGNGPKVAARINSNIVTLTQGSDGFDGNTNLDVSNIDNVRSKDFAGGRTAGLVVAPGQKVELDFSPGRDPEGVLGQALDTNGIFYRYEMVRGRGYILPSSGFERRASGNDNHPDPANWSNWGMNPKVVPRGDGPVDMTVRVRARDYGGRESTRDLDIRLLNEPPVIDSVETDVYARGPQIDPDQQVEIGNLGNRRYRVIVEARPDPGVDASLTYRAHDKYGQDVTATADLDGDGNADGDAVAGNAGRFTLTFNNLPEGGQNYNARVEVSDGNDSVTKIIRIYIPAISAEAAANMRYSIDVGNDGSFELVNSRSNNVEFRLPPGQNTINISGSVEANGQRIPFNLGDVSMPNEAPRFQNPRIVSQDGFDVVVAAAATDSDGDPVTITVDWGDGNTSRGRNVIYRHSYANARFQEYTVQLRATDDRGLFDEHALVVDILRPAIKESDVSSLTWTRVTETEGNYDGIRSFNIDPAGTLFTHNYMDIVRRSTNGGEDWVDILRDVECCGGIATKNAGEVYVASPAGLYFSGDNGDNWELYDESKFLGVSVSPDQNYIVAATKDELKRFDTTGRFIDTHRIAGEFADIETCAAGNRSAFTSRVGQMFVNDRRDMNPAGWRVPEDRFAKGKGESSVSFDKACNLYQGMWNGYRILKADNSIVPSAVKVPKHLIHPLGSNSKNIYGGTGSVYDVLAWPDGAAIVGSDRGIWGENEPWNAYRKPYWKKRDRGVDRSKTVRALQMHPTSGYAYMATSSAVQLPKYCRKARRGARGRRRRGRRARVQYYYVFCGFKQNFYGGLYRSENPLLLSRTVGEGGREFDQRYGRGVAYDGNQGGLVVSVNEEQKAYLWLVNTAESTISKWDPGRDRPSETGKYRVGIPAGECPGSCCWDDGCNMPSRVALDSAGDTYVASRGFAMQGTVTKIAGDVERCVDRNNNGRIETSRNGEAMAYGADECVIWTRPVGPVNAVLRALTVDQGDNTHPNGYVWVGSYNNPRAWKLNPETGEAIADVELAVPAYGMIVNSSGTLYVSTLGSGQLQEINTVTNQAGPVIDNPGGLRDGGASSYGVAIDDRGRIWMNGWGTPDAIAYDPADGTWCRMGLPFGMTVGRGITMDPSGRMWAAMGGDGASHVAFWDADECVSGQSNDVPRRNLLAMENGIVGPSAIGSDEKGRMWLAHKDSEKLVMIEPDNNFRVTTFDGTNRVYSYSDFTGVLRRMSIGQGSYEHDFEADCDNPQWTALDWSARTPAGSSISFTAQTAAQRAKLIEGQPVNVGRSPGDLGPINLSGRLNASNVESRRFLRIRASLALGEDNRSPVLQTFTVRWNCD